MIIFRFCLLSIPFSKKRTKLLLFLYIYKFLRIKVQNFFILSNYLAYSIYFPLPSRPLSLFFTAAFFNYPGMDFIPVSFLPFRRIESALSSSIPANVIRHLIVSRSQGLVPHPLSTPRRYPGKPSPFIFPAFYAGVYFFFSFYLHISIFCCNFAASFQKD